MPVFIRFSLIAATAIATAVPGVQMAEAQTAKPAAQAPKPISKADYTKNVDARFNTLDINHDNVLSKDEIAAAQQKAMNNARAVEQQRMEASFKKLDTNKDGSLSLAEFKAAAPPVRASETPDQMLGQLDKNKDGKVSLLEYRAGPVAAFDKMDANHDGTVTPQEVAAARKK
jgi:Ca2+-binding EF-hand superfamily protein